MTDPATTALLASEAVNSPSFITTLGLDPKLLIAQLINFAVIVFVLWKWGYKPLVTMMDARTKRIEDGLENAKRLEEELVRTHDERAVVLDAAKQEARELLVRAGETAKTERAETVQQTKRETEKIIESAKKMIQEERERMMAMLRADLAVLVVAATEKILGEKLTSKKDDVLVATAIEAVNGTGFPPSRE